MPQPFYFPGYQALSSSGTPLGGAKLHFFKTGTSTPEPVYADAARTAALSNPVIADSNGRFPQIYPDPAVVYRAQLTDSSNVQQWQQDGVCLQLFPRTQAEVAANVTPFNYLYPQGDVRRYGATGDGATDDTAAIQAAFNVATQGRSRVHFPATRGNQTVYRCAQIKVSSGTQVTADCGVIVEKNAGTDFTYIFEADTFVLGTATALTTTDASPATKTVIVSDATGLSPGQVVLIRDSTYAWHEDGQGHGRNQEINEIESIAGTTNATVTLKNYLMGSYALASDAELLPFTTPLRDVLFDGVVTRVPPGVSGGCFYISHGYNCEVRNCGGSGMEHSPGVQLWYCVGTRLRGGHYRDGRSVSQPGRGYGFAINGCRNCEAEDVHTSNVRENALGHASAFCRIKGCRDIGPYDNSWNTHAAGVHHCQIVENTSIASRKAGVIVGFTQGKAADYANYIARNAVYHCGGSAFESYSDSGLEQTDNVFEDNEIHGFGQQLSSKYGYYFSRVIRPIVHGGRVLGGNNNCRASIYFDNSTGVVVKDVFCRNNPNGWGVIHDTCTGVEIDSVVFDAISGGNVHSTGTASTAVRVSGCRADDSSYTRNAGDVFANNYWGPTAFEMGSGLTVGPFTLDNVAASQSNAALNGARWIAPRPGSVTGVVVKSTAPRSAGTLTITVYRNTGLSGATGSSIGLAAVLDGTNTATKVTTQVPGADTFAAGDEIYVVVTTDSSWAPVTADIRVFVEVAY